MKFLLDEFGRAVLASSRAEASTAVTDYTTATFASCRLGSFAASIALIVHCSPHQQGFAV